MINASNQFSNIIQMQPNRRNKKYKTSLNKNHKNGKTTFINKRNIFDINNEENSYEKILDRIMDNNIENKYLKKKKINYETKISDINSDSTINGLFKRNNKTKLTTKNNIKINSYFKTKKKKEMSCNILEKVEKGEFDKNKNDLHSEIHKNLSDINNSNNKECYENEKNIIEEKKDNDNYENNLNIKNYNNVNEKSNKTIIDSEKLKMNSNKKNKEIKENKEIEEIKDKKDTVNNKILSFEENIEEEKENSISSMSIDSKKNNKKSTKSLNENKSKSNDDDDYNNLSKTHTKKEENTNNNIFLTPNKNNLNLNSSNYVEENNEKNNISKLHFRSISKSDTKNNNNSINRNDNDSVKFYTFNFTIYANKKRRFCCF